MKIKSMRLNEAHEHIKWSMSETTPSIDGFRREAMRLARLSNKDACQGPPLTPRQSPELRGYEGDSASPEVWLTRGLVEATFPEHREIIDGWWARVDIRAAAMQEWITERARYSTPHGRTAGWHVLDTTRQFAETQTLPGCDELLKQMLEFINSPALLSPKDDKPAGRA